MLFLAMSFLLIDNINLLGLVYIMTQRFLSFDKDNINKQYCNIKAIVQLTLFSL